MCIRDRGLQKQMRADLQMSDFEIGSVCCEQPSGLEDHEDIIWDQIYDAKGQELDPKHVNIARQAEIAKFTKYNTVDTSFTNIPKEQRHGKMHMSSESWRTRVS